MAARSVSLWKNRPTPRPLTRTETSEESYAAQAECLHAVDLRPKGVADYPLRPADVWAFLVARQRYGVMRAATS